MRRLQERFAPLGFRSAMLRMRRLLTSLFQPENEVVVQFVEPHHMARAAFVQA